MKIFKFKCKDRMFAVKAENKEKACIKLRDALLKEQERIQEDSSGIDYGYLTEEEKKAIQDYKDAIAKTNDPKLLNIFAHILKEETEHIGELSEAEGVDQVGAISVPDLTEDSAAKVKDSDRLKKLAYEFASMGSELDRANSAQSRDILSRGDEAKIAKLYQKGLEVFAQLKEEVPKISVTGNDRRHQSPYNSEVYKLLLDGNHGLYWGGDAKCRALSKKIEELLDEYRKRYYDSASVKDKDYIVVYKENGTWKATPEENYNSRIKNANQVTDLSKFEDPREAVEYLKKYGGAGKEYKILEGSSVKDARQINYDDDIIKVFLNGKEVFRGRAEDWCDDDFYKNFKWTGSQYESQNSKGKWVVKVVDNSYVDYESGEVISDEKFCPSQNRR